MTSPPNLSHLLDTRRVLLCVGCGGVGKTTTCAALGLAAAQRGKRVLCLTIDPARRLAQSLGLTQLGTEAQPIDAQVFKEAGLEVPGSLTVMMLDTKSTFDNLVDKLAANAEKRQSILNNVLYQYISSSLAGTQEYMAMEKLYAVKDDPAYDLILLDTPPTSHALDFLDAPQRLAHAMDSAAVRWFLKAFETSEEKSGAFSLNLLKRSAKIALQGIGKITGGGFLEQVAEFVREMNGLFGGWRARADEVSKALRGEDVAYVMVTSPDPMAIREVLFFSERLREQGMAAEAFVVNRLHACGSPPTKEAVQARLDERGLKLEAGAVERILLANAEEHQAGAMNRQHLQALTHDLQVHVPDFPADIHDVKRLAWVAKILAPLPTTATATATAPRTTAD